MVKKSVKFLVASDKFKGSLTGEEACDAIKKGVLSVLPSAEVKTLPLADGGEGSLEAIETSIGFKRVSLMVSNPVFKPVKAFYGLKNNIAYIEMAKASGLLLLSKQEQNAHKTSTFGTGELIKDALKKGAKKIYLFVGGSATNDAGIGMAQALGFKFYDADNKLLKPIGSSLSKIAAIKGELIEEAKRAKFIVVTDVVNPFYGKNGAAHVFAAQKGASLNDIENLDIGLKNINTLSINIFNQDLSKTNGAGAAGGLAGGAILFLNATIKPGIDTIMELLQFDNFLKNADYVITGEGKLDTQTLEGKVINGVMNKCTLHKKPLGIVCGVNELADDLPVKACLAIMDVEISLNEAINNAYSLVQKLATQLVGKLISD